MLVDFSDLNAVFDLDPLVLDIDEQDNEVEFSGCFRNGFRGKKHAEESKRLIQAASAGKNNPRYGVRLTEEEKKACCPGQDYSGSKNPNAKTFIFTDPDGVEHIVIGGFKSFCREKGISIATMSAAVYYERTGPRKNGWSVTISE